MFDSVIFQFHFFKLLINLKRAKNQKFSLKQPGDWLKGSKIDRLGRFSCLNIIPIFSDFSHIMFGFPNQVTIMYEFQIFYFCIFPSEIISIRYFQSKKWSISMIPFGDGRVKATVSDQERLVAIGQKQSRYLIYTVTYIKRKINRIICDVFYSVSFVFEA